MKNLVIILLITISLDTCSQETLQSENIVITYEAASRGGYTFVSINSDSLVTQTSRVPESKSATKTGQKNWNKLMGHLQKLSVENLSSLQPPSDKRLYDGAAHATLTIIKNGTAYTTQSFDHDEPPKEIEALVKAILTMAKVVE